MLITLNVFTNKFKPNSYRDSLPFEMMVWIIACCLQPEILPLEHRVSDKLRVVIWSNYKSELQWVQFGCLCDGMRSQLGLPIYVFMFNRGVEVHHPLPIIHLLAVLHLVDCVLLLLLLPIINQLAIVLVGCQVLQLNLWRIVHYLLSLCLQVRIVLIQELANLRNLRSCQITTE